VSLIAAHFFWVVGAVWLVLSRLGLRPRGFAPPPVLLPAAPLHFRGVPPPILVAPTRRRPRPGGVPAFRLPPLFSARRGRCAAVFSRFAPVRIGDASLRSGPFDLVRGDWTFVHLPRHGAKGRLGHGTPAAFRRFGIRCARDERRAGPRDW